jgi:UDPglucose--hexose-1-phosphate uridylyltransferase
MREIRQNLITKDWVIFATDRGKRPHEFADPQFPEPTSLPQYRVVRFVWAMKTMAPKKLSP